MKGSMLLLIVGLFVGCGAFVASLSPKDLMKGIIAKLDVDVLLSVFFPVIFYLTPHLHEMTDFSRSQVKVVLILIGLFVVLFCVCYLFAVFVLRLGGAENRAKLIGFLTLASCANTGHGLMLVLTTAASPAIASLAVWGFYPGYIWVTFLPQFLLDRSQLTRRYWVVRILAHPISYSCIIGMLDKWSGWAATIYLILLAVRLVLIKTWEKSQGPLEDRWQPWVAMLLVMTFDKSLSGTGIHQFVYAWFPLAMTCVTAFGIGLKMGSSKMTADHWKIVVGINVFGLVVAPMVSLLASILVGCSFEETYVIVYLQAQPAAYLGMVWLRSGKFGEELQSLSEWAFVAQAFLAYTLGAYLPDVIRWVYTILGL